MAVNAIFLSIYRQKLEAIMSEIHNTNTKISLGMSAEVQPQQLGSAEGEDGLQTARKELEPTPQLHAADDPIY